MKRRVLVTRPEPVATETAGKLRGLGYDPVMLPLTHTVPTTPSVAIDPRSLALVAVTSANAIRHAQPDLLAMLRNVPAITVGDRTAAAANEAGLADVASAGADASALARAALGRTEMGDRIAYLCGRVRRPDFELALAVAGREVVAVETYDTVDLDLSDAKALEALAAMPVDAVLVYSENAAKNLNRLIAGDARRHFAQATFYCLSERIGTALAAPMSRIRIAGRPEQEALFDVLQREG